MVTPEGVIDPGHAPMSRTRYAINSFAGQVVFAAIAFGGAVLSARLLGAHGKGHLTAWTLAAAMGALILATSIPTGLGRAYLRGDRSLLLPTATAHAALALLAAIAAALVSIAAGADVLTVALFVVIAVPSGVLIQDTLLIAQAAKSPWLYHGIRMIGAGTLTVGLLVLYISPHRYTFVEVGSFFAGGTLLSALFAASIIRRRYGAHGPRALREALDLGRGSFSATLLDVFLLRCDQFVVVAIAGPAALGIYAVGVNWAEIGQYLGHSIGQAVFEDEDTLSRSAGRRILWRSALVVSAATVVVAGIGFVLVEPLFGAGFASSKWVLLLLAPGIPARSVGYAGGQMLLGAGRGTTAARITMASAIVAVPAWSAGALIGGVKGAAISSSLVYVLNMLLIVREFRHDEAGPPNGDRSGIAAAPAAASAATPSS